MRILVAPPTFLSRLRKFLKYHPDLKERVAKTLRSLKQDLHAPSLGSHKLHGRLGASWGCDINRQYRIVFSFDDKHVYLESIGDHDDVY